MGNYIFSESWKDNQVATMYEQIKVFLIWTYFQLIGVWKILQEQIWDRHRSISLAQMPNVRNKTLVITGGNRGIGFEAVKMLIPYGCHVIIGCRRPIEASEIITKSLEEEKKKILNEELLNTYGSFECLKLNVASLQSVRDFVSEISKRQCDVNMLINNAGVMFGPYELSEDGLENQMATNYFGHFLLTSLLLPTIKATAEKTNTNSRIINVASCAHFAGSWLNFDDLNAKKYYSAYQTYCNSKACQIMFTKYLDQKLRTAECENVHVNCIHPGVVNTGLFQHVGWTRWFSFFPLIFFKNAKQGGESIVYAVTSSNIDGIGGLYIDNGRPVRSSSFVNNVGNQTTLWEKSCEILQISEFGVPI